MTSPSIQLGVMNHIGLPTADPARGERFYVEVLGYRVVPRPPFSFAGRWLYRDEVGPLIHLLQVPGHVAPTGPINTLETHFAIRCEDANDVVSLLNEKGIEFVDRKLPGFGYRQIFFRDPDGNLIELGEWPDPREMIKLHTQSAGTEH